MISNKQDLIETARRFYLQAEKENDDDSRRKLFLQSADGYLTAAQSLENIDEQTRAGLVFLATVAIKRANSRLESTASTYIASKSSDLSTNDDRLLTYSTIRTKISGVRKIPKAEPTSKQYQVQDLFLLQTKLADIGIPKGSPFLPSYTPNNAGLNDLSASKHLSSPLGESFMVLNQSIHGRKMYSVSDYKKGTNINQVASDPSHSIANSSLAINVGGNSNRLTTPIKTIQKQSNQMHISRNGDDEVSPPTPSWTGVLNWVGFSSPDSNVARDSYKMLQQSPSLALDHASKRTSDGRMFSTENMNESLYWNEQSTMMNADMAASLQPSQGSIQNSRHFEGKSFSTQGDMDVTRLFDELNRLQKTIKVLSDENAEMHEKLTTQVHLVEQNKVFKKEMEEFKKEYIENFEKLKLTLSEFASTYPSPNNPANIAAGYSYTSNTNIEKFVHNERYSTISSSSTPKSVTPIRSTSQSQLNGPTINRVTSISTISPSSSNQIDSNAATKSSESERISQLEVTIQRLLGKIEQRDGKLKKYEDYYAKQKAKAEEKKKSSDGSSLGFEGNISEPTTPTNMTTSATASVRRPTTSKHPSTSTLQTSIQRNQSKNG